MLRASCAGALVLALTLVAGCSDPEDPISVEGNAITVLNQSDHDWRNVLIVVNDHFRGGASVLKANGRLNAPVSQFDTGFGQRWQIGTPISKIVVTAEAANGEAIKLDWQIGQGRRRQ